LVQQISDKFWQAEARTEETKRFIRDIKRITRRKFTAEEKIRIVLEGFRRDTSVRDLCRREGIRPSTYYAWIKDFMEAGKERLQRDTARKSNPASTFSLSLKLPTILLSVPGAVFITVGVTRTLSNTARSGSWSTSIISREY
jgi:transposase